MEVVIIISRVTLSLMPLILFGQNEYVTDHTRLCKREGLLQYWPPPPSPYALSQHRFFLQHHHHHLQGNKKKGNRGTELATRSPSIHHQEGRSSSSSSISSRRRRRRRGPDSYNLGTSCYLSRIPLHLTPHPHPPPLAPLPLLPMPLSSAAPLTSLASIWIEAPCFSSYKSR
ncbi:unnamed protein product [Pleuronectes platessa]|uniref:Uncharacterized protein n=1 Tax=Pleuronectes platessa TaxID=8262 RepID=A0A9N7VNB9_PLEPL|nr:unnamed protein product [Pleuronectes platessa]